MKEIPLSQGKVAIVDDVDFEVLSRWKWNAYQSKTGTWYAKRYSRVGPRTYREIRMHRQILRLGFGRDVLVDHRDGNGLNNQRENLRRCSEAQNQQNSTVSRHKTNHNFKGVWFHSARGLWRAQIGINGRNRFIGHFLTQEAAALAYNEAAKIHFGEFARLNQIK